MDLIAKLRFHFGELYEYFSFTSAYNTADYKNGLVHFFLLCTSTGLQVLAYEQLC